MTDIRREQLKRARKDLEHPTVYPPIDGNEFLIGLLGREAVAEVARDARQRIKAANAKLRQPSEPVLPELSPRGQAYWDAVEKLPPEPATGPTTNKKAAMPKRLKKPKLGPTPHQRRHQEWSDSVADLVFMFDDLEPWEKEEFEAGRRMGEYVLPVPKYLRLQVEHAAAIRDLEAVMRINELEESKAAWIAGFDKALGRGTGMYRVGGRLSADISTSEEPKD